MADITNDIYIDFKESNVSVQLSDEGVISLNVIEGNDISVEHVDQPIEVTAGLVGPPGSGLGTMLQDYSIKGQLFTWTGTGDINVDNGNTIQIELEADTVLNPITGWPGVGEEGKVTLYVKQGSGPFNITWPAGILWTNGFTPELVSQAGRWDVFVLTTIDAGATIFGFHVGTTV